MPPYPDKLTVESASLSVQALHSLPPSEIISSSPAHLVFTCMSSSLIDFVGRSVMCCIAVVFRLVGFSSPKPSYLSINHTRLRLLSHCPYKAGKVYPQAKSLHLWEDSQDKLLKNLINVRLFLFHCTLIAFWF